MEVMEATERRGLLSLATIGSDLATDLASELAGVEVKFSERVVLLGTSEKPYDVACVAALSEDLMASPVKPDLSQLQSNLLREQIGNLSREVSAARQDINTLRLADSQYEVQNAEMSRHVRAMQAQLRAEMQEQMSQFQDFGTQVEVGVTSSQAQAARAEQTVMELQERMNHDVSIAINRTMATFEENFSSRMEMQHLQLKMDQKDQAVDELTSEVQSMKRNYDAQFTTSESTMRQAIFNCTKQLDGEMQGCSERLEAFNIFIQCLEEKTQTSMDALGTNTRFALDTASANITSQLDQLATGKLADL